MVGTEDSRVFRGPLSLYGDSAGGHGAKARTKHQGGNPRVKLLIQSLSAPASLSKRQEDAIRQVL
jgi:hypothetical protein